MSPRSVGELIAALCLVALATRTFAVPVCRDCNVVLVTIDVFRADELQDNGSKKTIMPNLESLGAKGIQFTQAYSPSAGTTPADLSILSGLYPWHHEVNVPLRDDPKKILWSKSNRTLPGFLRQHGYEIFETSLGDTDGLNQFMQTELPMTQTSASPNPRPDKPFFLLVRSSLHDPYYPELQDVQAMKPGALPIYPERDDVARCDAAALALRKAPVSLRFPRDNTDFFFLLPNDQQRLSKAFDSADPIAHLSEIRGWDPTVTLYTLSSQCFWSFFSSSTIGAARILYDATARGVDRTLGSFLAELSSKGLLDHTIVVVTSQHGEAFLEHGEINHCNNLHDEIVRVPLIIDVPGGPQGKVVPDIVRSVDIMPTILDAVGLKPKGHLDGESVLPCAASGCPDRKAFAYFNRQYAVRDASYTYMRSRESDQPAAPLDEQLYDRKADPGEKKNLAGLRSDVTSRYRALLDGAIKKSDLQTIDSGSWPDYIDAKMREEIINTGYW